MPPGLCDTSAFGRVSTTVVRLLVQDRAVLQTRSAVLVVLVSFANARPSFWMLLLQLATAAQ